MEEKIKFKTNEKQEMNSNIESFLEIKRTKRHEENFQRDTLLHLLEKIKEEVYTLKIEKISYETDTKKYKSLLYNERLQENNLRDKINSSNSLLNSVKIKNSQEKSENNLALNFYNSVIDQKWAFLNAADNRNKKKKKIAEDAKYDSQDKEELEKRKVLSLCFFYNKYLRKKMEKELKDSAIIEETFQTLKNITVININNL